MAAVHHTSKYRRAAEAYRKSFNGSALCWLCGTPISFTAHHNAPSAFSTDHAVAVSTGQADPLDTSLWRPAHRSCNSSRKDTPDAKRTRPYIPPGEPRAGALASRVSVRVSVAASGCQGLDDACAACSGPEPKPPCTSRWGSVSYDAATGLHNHVDREDAPAAPQSQAPAQQPEVPAPAPVIKMARPASLRLV